MSSQAAHADFKARKEAFVSNLAGGSIPEITLVTLVAPSAVLLWTALQRRHSFFTPYGPLALVTDFLLVVCSVLFAMTAYSAYPAFLNISLAVPAFFLLLPLQTERPSANGPAKKSSKAGSSKKLTAEQMRNAPTLPRSANLVSRPFLTHYRGGMMITTVLAILAVDFPIFPRRFAKVETWGTSLMDLGVGSFVFAAGVVSARSLYKDDPSGHYPGIVSRLLTSIRHAVPLLVLGIVRLLSVKGLDYAEHVSEYGVHWNFFFTLALLPPFVEAADSLLRAMSSYHETKYTILAVLIACVYEIVLDNSSLLSYILISPRGPALLSKNREGVFSFIGYLSIFLAGRGAGWQVVGIIPDPVLKVPRHMHEDDKTRRERKYLVLELVLDTIVFTLLYFLSTSVYTLNLNVSRRLANLPYVLWVVAFNYSQILLCAWIERFGPAFTYHDSDVKRLRNASSKIMRVFNSNGLAIFLVANLLTGLVNLTCNTLDMSNIGAMSVLIVYAAAVTAVALGLDYSGVKIKL
jgi:glucosaminylphosphatidylinositol acyltransferase